MIDWGHSKRELSSGLGVKFKIAQRLIREILIREESRNVMPADEKHGLPDSCEEKKSPFMNGYVHEKIKML